MVQCPSCQVMHYCSQECRRQDWALGHETECPAVKILYASENNLLWGKEFRSEKLLMIRLYLKITKNPDSAKIQHKLHNGGSKSFNDLLLETTEWQTTEHMKQIMPSIIDLFKSVSPEDLDEDFVHKVYYILSTNAFIIYIGEKPTALAFFIETTSFSHSCYSNTEQSFEGNKLTLKAKNEILADQKIFIQLVGLVFKPLDVSHFHVRQRLLFSKYYYDCCCKFCQSDQEATIEYYSCLYRNHYK